MLPTHLFLVDVSYAAISSGATAAVCSGIQQTLDNLPGALPRMHGLFLFSRLVQCVLLYNCSKRVQYILYNVGLECGLRCAIRRW